MARTYLERSVDEFASASKEELVQHGLRALRESLAQDKELTIENTSVAVVGLRADGEVEPFKLFEGQEVKAWIESIAEAKEEDAPAEGGEAAAPAESMDVDQ
jgi:20S proteasome subunit alpha 6